MKGMMNVHFIKRYLPDHWVNKLLKVRGSSGPDPYRSWHDETRSIFIHIPKTAGTSVANALYGISKPNHTKLKYFQAYDSERYESYFKCGVVRNPYDRFVSAVRNARKRNKRGEAYHKGFLNRFEEGISFEVLFDRLQQRSNRRYLKTLVLFQSQKDFLTDLSGSVGVDLIGRFENLEDFMGRLNERLDVKHSFGHLNKTGETPGVPIPADGYTILNSMYREDFETFGYERIEG